MPADVAAVEATVPPVKSLKGRAIATTTSESLVLCPTTAAAGEPVELTATYFVAHDIQPLAEVTQTVQLPLLTSEGHVTVLTAAPHPLHSAATVAAQSAARTAAAAAASASTGAPPPSPSFTPLQQQLVLLPAALTLAPAEQALVLVMPLPGRLIAVYGDFSIAAHRWAPTMNESGTPFDLLAARPRPLVSAALAACAQRPSLASSAAHTLDASDAFLRAWVNGGGADGSIAGTALLPLLVSTHPPSIVLSSRFAVVVPADGSSSAAVPSGPNAPVGARGTGAWGSWSAGYGPPLALDSAVIFSCGYVDGGLRWQVVPSTGRGTAAAGGIVGADLWLPRAGGGTLGGGRAEDVTCLAAATQCVVDAGTGATAAAVAAASSAGGAAALPERLLLTGHAGGSATLWAVVRGALASGNASDSSDAVREVDEMLAAGGPWAGHRCAQQLLLATRSGNGAPQPMLPSAPIVAGPETGVSLVAAVTYRGHGSPATAVALHRWLGVTAVGSLDGVLRLWAAGSGRLLRSANLPALVRSSLGGMPTSPTSGGVVLTPVLHIALLVTGYAAVHWRDASQVQHAVAADVSASSASTSPRSVAGDMLNGRAIGSESSAPSRHRSPSSSLVSRSPQPHASHVAVIHIGNGAITGYACAAPAVSLAATLAAAATRRGRQGGALPKRQPPLSVSALPAAVTTLTASDDGTALILGFADGSVEIRHALTLQLGGRFLLHEEPSLPLEPPGDDESETAVVPVVTSTSAIQPPGRRAGGLGGAFARLRAATTSNSPASGASAAPTIASLASLPPQQPGSGSIPGAAPSSRPHPAAAVTCVALTDGGRMLLTGTGDGRLCVAVDIEQAKRVLSLNLQAGLFGLVG